MTHTSILSKLNFIFLVNNNNNNICLWKYNVQWQRKDQQQESFFLHTHEARKFPQRDEEKKDEYVMDDIKPNTKGLTSIESIHSHLPSYAPVIE